jgi:tripartite-type tricarboxylate transporter receptor subunit TctC
MHQLFYRPSRRKFLYLSAAVLPAASRFAWAQNYPGRPVKIIVPFAPGGTTDIVARILAEELKNSFGQAFVVENKPGADGILAIHELVRSGGDGYTLMIGSVATNAIAPILYANKISFNYERDVVPVMRLVDIPGVLVATTRSFPPTTLPELVDYARQNPGKVTYGTPGIGNYAHYDMVLFAKRAGGLEIIAVPNKAGASGVINDLLVGTVQIAFVNAASTASHIQAGTLRALALANHSRLPALADVQTMQELGFDGVGTIAWQALFAPASTPSETLEKIRVAAAEAMQKPSAVQALQQQAFNLVPTRSLDEARSWLAAEMNEWRKITQETKLDPQN